MPANQNLNLNISSNPIPRSNPPGPITRPIARPKGALEKIDINKIGKGYLMTEGVYGRSFGIGKGVGLKGQLSAVRRAGIKDTTKNLSKKNIEQMHDLLAEAISKNAVSSSTYISRHDRINIMKKSRELAKTPNSGFSFEDRQDLLTIVDEMRRQHREKILGGQSREETLGSKPINANQLNSNQINESNPSSLKPSNPSLTNPKPSNNFNPFGRK